MEYGSVNVNAGDYIEKGAIIGTMGSTGNAYGNHLHLEIKNENGIKENPLESLNKEIKNEKQELVETNTEITNEQNINEKLMHSNENTNVKPNNENKESNITTPNIKKNESLVQTNTQNTDYLANSSYSNGSIVDALKEINIDSSYAYREKLASVNNITNYHGSYAQNVKLLKLLKEGNLKKA